MLCINAVWNFNSQYMMATCHLRRFENSDDAELACLFLHDQGVDAFINYTHSNKFTVWIELTHREDQWKRVSAGIAAAMEMFTSPSNV